MKSRNWFRGWYKNSLLLFHTFLLAFIHSYFVCWLSLSPTPLHVFLSTTLFLPLAHSTHTLSLTHTHTPSLSLLLFHSNKFLSCYVLQISALTIIIDRIQDYVIYVQNNLKLHNLGKTRVNLSTAGRIPSPFFSLSFAHIHVFVVLQHDPNFITRLILFFADGKRIRDGCSSNCSNCFSFSVHELRERFSVTYCTIYNIHNITLQFCSTLSATIFIRSI